MPRLCLALMLPTCFVTSHKRNMSTGLAQVILHHESFYPFRPYCRGNSRQPTVSVRKVGCLQDSGR